MSPEKREWGILGRKPRSSPGFLCKSVSAIHVKKVEGEFCSKQEIDASAAVQINNIKDVKAGCSENQEKEVLPAIGSWNSNCAIMSSARELQLVLLDESYKIVSMEDPNAREFGEMIRDVGFWNLEVVHSLVRLVKEMAHEFVTDRPFVGKCLHPWEELRTKVKDWCVKLHIAEALIKKLIERRFRKNYHPAWSAAYILDPLYLLRNSIEKFLPPFICLASKKEKDVVKHITRLVSREKAHIALIELIKWRTEGLDPVYAQAIQLRQRDPSTGKMKIANPHGSRHFWKTYLLSLGKAQKMIFIAAHSKLDRRDFTSDEERFALATGQERNLLRSWLGSGTTNSTEHCNMLDTGQTYLESVGPSATSSNPSYHESRSNLVAVLPSLGFIESLSQELFKEFNDMYGGMLTDLISKIKDKDLYKSVSAMPAKKVEGEFCSKLEIHASAAVQINNIKDVKAGCSENQEKEVLPAIGSWNSNCAIMSSARELQLVLLDESYKIVSMEDPNAREFGEMIRDVGFWNLEVVHSLVRLVKEMAHEFVTDRPFVGKCLHPWEELRTKVKDWCVKLHIAEALIKKLIERRFRKNYHPAWSAAYILDPLYLLRNSIEKFLPPFICLASKKEKDVVKHITRLVSREKAHIALIELIKWRTEGLDPVYAQAIQLRQRDPSTGKMKIANPHGSRHFWKTYLLSLGKAQKMIFIAAHSKLDRRDFTSDEERFALATGRMTHSTGGKDGRTWADVVRGVVRSSTSSQAPPPRPPPPPPPPPPPRPTVDGLLLPTSSANSSSSAAASTETFVFCLSMPKAETLLRNLKDWEHNLNDYVIHGLRLLKEPPNGYGVLFDDQIASVYRDDSSILWATFTFLSKKLLQEHQWIEHGDKQQILTQQQYFHNSNALFWYFYRKARLAVIREQMPRGHLFKENGLCFKGAQASTVRNIIKRLCGVQPQIICDPSCLDKKIVFEIRFQLDEKLEPVSFPDEKAFLNCVATDIVYM